MRRGGIVKAAYIDHNLTVQSIAFIPKLRDAASRRQRQPEQNKKETPDFDDILKRECDKTGITEEKICYTAGYTRDAKPVFYVRNSRTYG